MAYAASESLGWNSLFAGAITCAFGKTKAAEHHLFIAQVALVFQAAVDSPLGTHHNRPVAPQV
jgi:hypothetical protein